MIEADPLTILTVATDAGQTLLQAGPPSDLPAQVPDFVTELLDTVRNSTGEDGLGETISELTPGGSEHAGAAGQGAGAGAENASK
ncbi:hypothetical protein [Halodesulfurarchaeum formicicum]|uniref:Uncharacterized protein n=1 Tax=Halodesulfurarchaeum formicicum TaxID=1873524 RepID=A0A1J1ACU3_9EURY|nr:hypothetical protein [Halodesulfurarchaeum formicicum]APE95401.1 hypothetical protein HSR6_0948 [Halodesulfurarchaeum formicicum]